MKSLTVVCAMVLLASPAFAQKKFFPGQAGNDNIELSASVMLDPAEIQQAVGASLGEGIAVFRVKATNKTGDPMRIGPADFTAVSRRDGDRGDALAPGQLAGGSTLIIKRDRSGRDYAQQSNQPGFTGVQGVSKADKPIDNALLESLKAKELPNQETKPNGSVEGLVYFSLNTKKLKSKDAGLIYKGPAGHLTIDFK